MMWYVTHFDDILKMKALKEPNIMIPDLQTSIGKSCMLVQSGSAGEKYSSAAWNL